MPMSNEIPSVSFNVAKELLPVALAADTPILLIGDPGVGKSALAKLAAASAGLPLMTLLGSTIDPTDVAGIPFLSKDGTSVKRFPLEVIRRACAEPVLLFLDEISCAPPVVQAALLRLILDRMAGDSQLHEGTRVIAAANPPEQAPGGFELSAPLIGRVTIIQLRPTSEEVLDYFMNLGDEGSSLNVQSQDFALTCGAAPDLLQIAIPPDAVTGNAPWGAPRSWERAIRARAAGVERGASEDVLHALMEGAVGAKVARAYNGYLKARKVLPTVDEIVKSPTTAKLPKEHKEQVAVLGIISHVAARNTWAAYLYANRLERAEYRAACAKLLQKKTASPMTAPHAKEGIQARVKLIQSLPKISA